MPIIRINLDHIRNVKPIRTVVSVNGVPLFEINTYASKLEFLLDKLTKSAGNSQPGEYWFEVPDSFFNPTGINSDETNLRL